MMMTSEDSPHAQQTQEALRTPTASEVIMTLIATSHRIQRVFNARLSRQKGAVKLSGPRLRLRYELGVTTTVRQVKDITVKTEFFADL